MALPTNLVTRYQATRVVPEDLSDVIELVAQEDTPYTANIGTDKCTQTFHEWNTDTLRAANDTNAAIEGDDVTTIDTLNLTSRMGDYTQIHRKLPGVSGTIQAINVVGGSKQLAREIMKAGRELKLDREARLVSVKPAVAGNDTGPTARQMAGFGAWIRTNVSRGATGANPTLSGSTEGFPNGAPTDGTQRAFTEALLKTVMQLCYTAGGKPTILLVPPAQKVAASAFPGLVVNRYQIDSVGPAKIIGTADVYLSDFGRLAIVPDPFMRSRDAWLVDPTMAQLMTLRPTQTIDLAQSGDNEKRLMLWEGTHKINNEKAHGAIADLT